MYFIAFDATVNGLDFSVSCTKILLLAYRNVTDFYMFILYLVTTEFID